MEGRQMVDGINQDSQGERPAAQIAREEGVDLAPDVLEGLTALMAFLQEPQASARRSPEEGAAVSPTPERSWETLDEDVWSAIADVEMPFPSLAETVLGGGNRPPRSPELPNVGNPEPPPMAEPSPLRSPELPNVGNPEPPPAITPEVMGGDLQASPAAEESKDDLGRFQSLFSELLFGERQQQIEQLENQVRSLNRQLNEPDELIELLLPLIAELLSLKVDESRDEVIRAMVPIIDQVIQEKTDLDKVAMVTALSRIVPGAISKRIHEAPMEVIQAIAPAMGQSIKEQIRLERDSMVDALYPVIGNTIKKYMGEVVRQINEQVENSLTIHGLQRKLRARLQGVSEAELILKESMPFHVRAVFLVHKASGLIMTEAQWEGDNTFEGDMLAGMLTAIRSLASECSVSPGQPSELTQIDYENLQILMEVAGYCYLTVILEGEPSRHFLDTMKETLSTIILNYGYGDRIRDFDGDSSQVPHSIQELVASLLSYRSPGMDSKRAPWGFLAIVGAVFLGLSLWGGWLIFRHHQAQRWQQIAEKVLIQEPELAIYPWEFTPQVAQRRLIVAGKVPTVRLETKALALLKTALPQLTIQDEVNAVTLPVDPQQLAAEVQRLTTAFNQLPEVLIHTEQTGDQVKIEGYVRSAITARKLEEAFRHLPGLGQVFITLKNQPFPFDQRLYFGVSSPQIAPRDYREKIQAIAQFLRRYPQIHLQIVGHADLRGSEQGNYRLAKRRAESVRQALITQGVSPQQLTLRSTGNPPPNLAGPQPYWLSRCVRFERIVLP